LRLHLTFPPLFRRLAIFFLLSSVLHSFTQAQQAPQKPADKPAAKDSAHAEPQNPAHIELLETKIRFEANGDSRKEVHTRVHINNELGVQQFARLNFDYNRSFQSIEIPLVHITHPSGGTADILASAVTDNPNPAVVNAPAYQDVRVKSVRILGLEPGDTLEYRVVTTTTHHPLAPDFWLDHSFDRSGVVSQQVFEVDLPSSRVVDSPSARRVEIRSNAATPPTIRQETDSNGSSRSIYLWQPPQTKSEKKTLEGNTENPQNPDVALSSFLVWGVLSQRLAVLVQPQAQDAAMVSDKALALAKTAVKPSQQIEALYNFVSREITTVDLPLEATGLRPRLPSEILTSGYATPEDKFVLLASLASSLNLRPEAVLAGTSLDASSQLPSPSLFTRILTIWGPLQWCDPGLEVAPFGLLSPDLRGKKALRVFSPPESNPLADVLYPLWFTVPVDPPFPSSQKVTVEATLAADGKLSAKVHYHLRGDNELLLRIAFHQSPKDNWKDLAQLLSLSDGFRGQVTSVNASDPYATREPFSVDYEISQPKFVDWSKKPVRIPALLPQLGLPDPPAKPAPGAATAPIELGTPLEVEAQMTLHLPPGTITATTPTGTSVQRDYATFASQYSAKGQTVSASRHINFLLRQVPVERAADYNAFLRAVLGDEAQDFTLDRESTPGAAAKSAASQASPSSSPKP
jgi:Domain of Unknown Function with PDB structure (DUF3857)